MYEQRALQYRGECLRSMRDSMPGDGDVVTDHTIGKALLLAINEVSPTFYYIGPYTIKRPCDNLTNTISLTVYGL